jgi:RNA polymerase sigma factor (sigma-70 family)
MTHSEQSSDDQYENLAELVLLCQQSHTDWSGASSEATADARAQHGVYLEQLWAAIADDLRRVARGWMRSNIAPDVESLALNMFTDIVFSLPSLSIDPKRNVRKFLITVARRRLIDEYRRISPVPKRRASQSSDEPLTPGAAGARMWQTGQDAEYAAAAADLDAGLADEASFTAEERLASRIDHQALLAAIWSYWPKSLAEDDLRIVQLRWETDPPRSFREIARQMGKDWGEATVRQRHHRILKATRAYLHSRGLLDDELHM